MTLDSDFEAKLQAAVLDDVEQTLKDEIGPQLKQVAEDNFKNYAQANGYDIEHVWQDAELSVERGRDSVTVTVEWPGLTALFEFGVDPHTIEGDPLLHFYWEEQDRWVQAEEVNWGSETGGINEAGAIRDAMAQIRRQLG